MSIPVFYRAEQSCLDANSYSPSADKPRQAVADWLKQGLITDADIMSFEPLTDAQLGLAHTSAYVQGVMNGEIKNGFGNRSLAVAKSLRFTTGSMLGAAQHALLHHQHVCSPTSGFHHANHISAQGFCTFNGLMVTAIALHAAGLARTVGILDIDQHYGNGTDDIIKYRQIDYVKHHTFGEKFHSRRSCEGDKFEAWLKDCCEDLQGCDVVLYQAGADPHINDPLGGCLSTEQMRLRDAYVFKAFKGKPLVWNLAGGYMRSEDGGIEPVLSLHRQTMLECINCKLTH